MAKVLFKFGTQAQYLALKEKLDNALYFLTDTGELYKGEIAVAKSHVYQGTRLTNEDDTSALARISIDYIPVEGDISILNTNGYIDAFIRSNNTWIKINNSTSQLENRVSNLESLVNNLGTVFTYKGAIQDLSIISNPHNGDVYSVNDAEYVWNGNKWIEFGTSVDLSNYATKDLIGTPTSSIIDSNTGEMITVPATGIYKELFEHADSILPLFNGTIAGLVPVADTTLSNEEKANKVLNALGNWITVNNTENYIAPDGTTYTNIEEYVQYMVTNYAELFWESMDE